MQSTLLTTYPHMAQTLAHAAVTMILVWVVALVVNRIR